jgi:hypothetical protein
MQLAIFPDTIAVCRFSPDIEIPNWVGKQRSLLSITYTDDELSIVCSESIVPAGIQCERGWRAIKVLGPLDFSLTGILASLVVPLAEHAIPIFALSTYDTDYLLLKETNLERACAILTKHGHQIVP